MRHTPANGVVSVTVEPDTDHVLVAVEDTGPGLRRTASRGCSTASGATTSPARATGGAGLGLAIAQGLVRAHGGVIWAENRTSGGARVAFTLPLAEPPPSRERA